MAPFGSLLAIVELEKEPPRFTDLGDQTFNWVIDAGGFAAVGLVIWILSVFTRPAAAAIGPERRPLVSRAMWMFAAASLAIYTAALVLTLLTASSPNRRLLDIREWTLFAAGLCAIAGIGEPFVRDFFRLRWRRIWALAKLSFKEAIRRRVVWAFMVFFLIFLFPASWIPDKPENELRKTINVIYYGMTPLLVLIALLLASFSIPNDIKNQTIHTIVTKPVERFEIVMGRFLGYALLLLAELAVLTTLSLFYVVRGVTPEAAEESYRARVPVYCDRLAFHGTTRPQ